MSASTTADLSFTSVLGVSSEDFLCVSEPDENERFSSGLDGDEVTHQQVSEDRFMALTFCKRT